jgi:hypothetical protein
MSLYKTISTLSTQQALIRLGFHSNSYAQKAELNGTARLRPVGAPKGVYTRRAHLSILLLRGSLTTNISDRQTPENGIPFLIDNW